MANYKTVPNQKVVRVEKEKCNNEKKENYYARINLAAMEAAAIDLDAGAFKLWTYFAKNQNGYEFALSSKAVADTYGIKKKQYDNAIAKLTDKGYLIAVSGNLFTFSETPVVSKGNNEDSKNHVVSKGDNDVVSFGDNDVVSKGNNTLYPKETRNTTHTTKNTTMDITEIEELEPSGSKSSHVEGFGEIGSFENPIAVDKKWLIERYNYLTPLANGVYRFAEKFYKIA